MKKNLTFQMMYLDKEGLLEKSHSIVLDEIEPGWYEQPQHFPAHIDLKPGAIGGSDFTNYELTRRLEKRLAGLLQPGDLASYVQSWDKQKLALDYKDGKDEDLTIELQGRRASQTLSVDLKASDVREIFDDTHKDIFRVLDESIRKIRTLGKRFAVLLTGGTSVGPGFRSDMKKKMEELGGFPSVTKKTTKKITKRAQAEARARKEGCLFTYDYLARIDGHWLVALCPLACMCPADIVQVIGGSCGRSPG